MNQHSPSHDAIVVTGLGCLGAYGIGGDALAAALLRGEALGAPVDRRAGYHRRNSSTTVATVAASAPDFVPWLSEDAGRRMSDLSQFAVVAARMALQHAGLAADGQLTGDRERTAVTIATAFGPGGFTEQLALQVLQKGGRFASPFLFTDCVANAAAGQIAIAVGARGPNNTICQREAGPLLALHQAVEDLRRGRADVCLCGAVDEMKPLSHAILDRFRAVARPHAEPGDDGELPRPFDLRRRGYRAGEGAAVLVLEREATARARGATILARVGPTVRAHDHSAGRMGTGQQPEALAEHLRERLGDRLDRVDLVVSGASGARAADAYEAALLHAALPHHPWIVAPKAVTGEFGGGTLAAALLALGGAGIAAPRACDRPDPALGVTLHDPQRDGPLRATCAMLTAHAAGGASAITLLERP
ncbi:MAG: hypothetical protein H6835_19195 [Planctomycetes bacterium]|nr:hypothetical protein [Planctomycetota bacterium]